MPDYAPPNRIVARRIQLGLLAAGVIALIAAGPAIAGWLAERIAGLRDGAGEVRPGAVVYALGWLFTLAAAALPLPIEAPAFLNGTLFPAADAFLLTWTGAMAGCALSYELGRRLGRAPAQRLFGAARLARVEALIGQAGWPTLLALRLSPVMAFTALNWASGILALSRTAFYWTTAAGVTPGTFVFTVTPGLLRHGGSTALILGLAFAVVVGLLAMSWLRVRRARA